MAVLVWSQVQKRGDDWQVYQAELGTRPIYLYSPGAAGPRWAVSYQPAGLVGRSLTADDFETAKTAAIQKVVDALGETVTGLTALRDLAASAL